MDWAVRRDQTCGLFAEFSGPNRDVDHFERGVVLDDDEWGIDDDNAEDWEQSGTTAGLLLKFWWQRSTKRF